MSVSYYRCPIEGHGEIVVGVLSAAIYRSVKVTPSRHNPEALVIKLYQEHSPTESSPASPITQVLNGEITENQRLQSSGDFFEVGYPWGTQFVEKLEDFASQSGLETYQDPFKEGSDSHGILVGRSEDLWKVAPLLDERAEYCNENPDDEDAPWTMEDPIFDACREHGVIWLDTDWKHFEIDLDDFSTLGITAERVDPVVISQPEELEVDEVLLFGEDKYMTFSVRFSLQAP